MKKIKNVKIGNILIGPDSPPLIIAEMSGNHKGSLEKALEIVEAAAEAGATALKLQTYLADTMTLDIKDKEFVIQDPESLWYGRTLYDLYEEAHTPWEWHEPIFKRCHELGMIAFSSPFDKTAVDFLEGLQVPAYKIASLENTDVQLIRYVAKTGKPLILSTGTATFEEIAESIDVARSAGAKEIILLKCTAAYPAEPQEMNLNAIPYLQEKFGVPVGLSDHTEGISVAMTSIGLGASVIEKHITLNRAEGGVDAPFSLEPHELKSLVLESKKAWLSLGAPTLASTPKEEEMKRLRRSLYVIKDMKKGQVFNSDNIKAIRPGLGLPTKHLDVFEGKKAKTDIKRGTPLSWELAEGLEGE